jgi:predicted secreted hydrolase
MTTARVILLLAPAALAALPVGSPPGPPDEGGAVRLAPAAEPPFARALAARAFRLPEDHGPHFEFQTEWWYYTGNLRAADGRRFGFQLTFFRRGLSPGAPPPQGLATNQVYFAHFAVTDVAAGRHRGWERWSRGAAGLAGAQSRPFRVWLEDWSAESGSGDGSAVRLRARDAGLALDLELRSRKPLVAHGDRGLSEKGGGTGNASYYVGYTRLAANGRIGTDGGVEVSGEAWFDHEWSTSALASGVVGWDWWSLQLDDGRELMLFELRRGDGRGVVAFGGTLVAPDGAARPLRSEEVRVVVTGRWRSQESQAVYPSGWRITLPSEGLVLQVVPRLADQEMRASFVYWEGAVRVEGSGRGARLTGQGYVELTGYARSMQGVF